MSIRRQRLVIDLINIVMKFLLVYLLITILLYRIDSSSALHVLSLLPIPFISYLIKKKTHHVWSFLVLHGIIMVAYLILIKDPYLLIAAFIYVFVLTVANYYNKNKAESPDNASALLLILFVFYYILCYLGRMPSLMQLCFILSIVYVLLYVTKKYLVNLESFVYNHEWLTSIPFRQIRNSNNVMILFLSGLFLIIMLLFSLLPLGSILAWLGKLPIRLLRYLFSLLRFEEAEDTIEPDEEPTVIEDYPITEPSRLIEIILTILQWLAAILIVVLIITLILYTIYQIYQYFYLKSDETLKDKIEFLTPFMHKERVRQSRKKTLRNLFGHSNNTQIRKHYAQAVSAGLKEDALPARSLTPSQLSDYILPSPSNETATSSDKKLLITEYYEKARYSNEECSKEDVRTLKKLLKK